MSVRIVDKPGFNHMILRCPDGHEFVWRFKVPIPVDVWAKQCKQADKCVDCGKKKCVMLSGPAYHAAAERLAGIYAEDVS